MFPYPPPYFFPPGHPGAHPGQATDQQSSPKDTPTTPQSPSQDVQSSSSQPQTVVSPGQGYYPYAVAGHGFLSEPPHCYAPFTAEFRANNVPPPKFDLTLGYKRKVALDAAASSPHSDVGSTQSLVAGHQGTPGSNYETYIPKPPSSEIQAQRSGKLNALTNTPTGLPTLAMAMDPQNFPFVEGARQMNVRNYGVVKLRNIPFATKRSEVIAFLGRNSKILNDSDEPVHIIMERVTSKTMDAYVEFTTLEDAMKAVERHHLNSQTGRLSRLGDRPVEVELSSQASLMKDLFPLATGMRWDGATPEFKPFNHNEPWENFKGFISEEEMTMLVKHVEVPHRSPFSKQCPQRPFECLISTLKKFPWYVTDRITISQRRAVFEATCDLLRLLSGSIYRNSDPINLNTQLYKRVIASAMSCPGFSPMMKDGIAYIVNMSGLEQRSFGQPRFAECWRHQYALAPKPGIPLDVLEWYIAIIREQSHRDVMGRPLSKRTVVQEKGEATDMYWGYFWAEVGYSMGPQFDTMTLAQAAYAELTAVERILGRVFSG
ncbi:hypothetical protein B0I35DRAFT_360210 [Stachybotrys elegans]|uniref:RRM domain-containing protein n=1 Tax=Stachybotrys elegans TaxID=80388 RepID=A0A8K0SDM0_9HYPO|nr:hypothetical protein B0I35DRAFT_360210 [Stachybotrys elegans]